MLINQGASLKELAVIVVAAFVLLTGLDFLGAGHHPAPSIGAVSAQKTSPDRSPPWSGQDGASRLCRQRCGIAR